MTADDLFAVSAAALWVISTFVVGAGFRQLPSDRLGAALAGLNISLIAGSLVIGLLLVADRASSGALPATGWLGWPSPMAIAAGLFTFPIGTGLYYATTTAYQNTAQIAAQYVKVKPLASILLGVFLLGESIGRIEIIAIGCIVLGVAMFFVAGSRGRHSTIAVLLGLGTAGAWALGEAIVAMADAPSGLALTAQALISGTVLLGVLCLPIVPRLYRAASWRSMRWFALHGVLSFGLAYWLFFSSIGRIGLTRTVLLTAFWPGASLAVRALTGPRNSQPALSPVVWIAVALLLTAALLQALA